MVLKEVVQLSDVTDVSTPAESTLMISRGAKSKPLVFKELQRATAASELITRLVQRVKKPVTEMRASLRNNAGKLSSRANSARSSPTPVAPAAAGAVSPRQSLPAATSNGGGLNQTSQSAPVSMASNTSMSSSREDVEFKDDEADATQMTSDDWNLLLGGAKCLTFAKNATIIAEGVEATRIYQIGRGVCRAEKGGQRLGAMQSGEIFGEISFLEGGKTTAAVVAEQDGTEVYVIEGGVLKVLFVRQPALGGRFFQYLSQMLSARLKARESR